MVPRGDVVIVGGGPAGAGTALALWRRDPELARRCVILDRALFPRDKTCAGGLIPHTMTLLRDLDLDLSVPHVRVDVARVDAGGPAIEIDSRDCCRVIRRREFDAMLLDAVRERGIEVREGVRVTGARREGDRIRLETTSGPLEARAVVAADGSASRLRRDLVDPGEGSLARATMCDVPIVDGPPPNRFEFDFRPVKGGLKGYAWSFPCLVEGRPHWNVGAYSLQRAGEGERIARAVTERAGPEGGSRKAHPIRVYERRGPLAAPGVLLVGDAAGVDPLLGEGISFALEYGGFAAEALSEGFARDELGFRGYTRRVRSSAMGRKLGRLALMARLFYGPGSAFWFRVARLSGRAQRIGMNWYNGEAG